MVIFNSESTGTLVSVGVTTDDHDGRKKNIMMADNSGEYSYGLQYDEEDSTTTTTTTTTASSNSSYVSSSGLVPTSLYLPSHREEAVEEEEDINDRSWYSTSCEHQSTMIVGRDFVIERDGTNDEDCGGYMTSSDFSSDDDDESDYSCYGSDQQQQQEEVEERLYLPQTCATGGGGDPLPFLPPTLYETRRELFDQKPMLEVTAQSQQNYVYVGQQEVAHAVPLQCDMLVSDRATTCHILALHSTKTTASESSSTLPLTTLTHLDGPNYANCVREMIQRHKEHHHAHSSATTAMMDIHIVGGFDDEDGASVELSTWLLQLLAQLANDCSDCIRMTLRTCVTGRWNTADNSGGPLGRGLAIETKTGSVQLAKVHRDAVGPCSTLRGMRLMTSTTSSKLACIHHQHSNYLWIEPMVYEQPNRQTRKSTAILLSLPDRLLLKYTSTSPEYEDKQDFCIAMRDCLKLMQRGISVPRGLKFKRVVGGYNNEDKNVWKQCGTFL